MKKRLTATLVAAALLVGGGVAAAFWWEEQRATNSGAAAPATTEAVLREFSSLVTAIGAVKPQIGAEVRVGTRISGKLMRLPANIGDRVERGQIIAELESGDLAAAVARHEAAVAVAREKISDAEARQRLSEATYQRQLSLLNVSGTSRQLVDEALRESQSAAAGVQIAIRERELADAHLREARVNLSYATITAPISGVISSVTTQEGETVAAGLNAPTFVVIVDLDRLQVNALVDEVDIGKIKLGQRATFNVDAFPAEDFGGSVSAIYPSATIQDNVVKYVVAIAIDDENRSLLRPEMTTSVRIQLESRTVLAVPARAIRQEGGRPVVHVVDGEATEIRPVRVGWRDGPWAEIADGLSKGERILLNATLAAREEEK